MKHYGIFLRFLRCCARLLTGWRSDQPPLSQPAVYLVHHQNLYGPLHALAFLSNEVRPWIFSPFCSRKACFQQYYGYTFTQRFGWPKPLAWMVSGILSLVIPALMNGYHAIPVYRDGRRVRETMSLSQETLLAGDSLLICPDVDYASSEGEMGRIYQGFLRLERDYHKQTGTHLPFVPAICDRTKKRMTFGEPVRFQDGIPFKQQQNEIAQQLTRQMNDLSRRFNG